MDERSRRHDKLSQGNGLFSPEGAVVNSPGRQPWGRAMAAVQPRRGDSTPAIQGLSPLRGWVVGAADVRPRGSRPWLFTTAPSGLSFQRTIPRRPAPCKAVACTFIQDTAPS